MSEFTIGCDPEIFLKDKDGNPLSAHNLLKGTKKEPFKVEKGAYQVDGIAAEFNTDPVPHTDFASFNANVVRVIKQMQSAVVESSPDARFCLQPVLEFDQTFCDALPEEAKELGCDPDYDAYTMLPNPRPDGDRLFRTGSGHLHVGWGAGIPVENEEHVQICAAFVKMLDATVGLLMTFIDRDPRRRELYGKAGAFRPKPYGVEYRTPSNVWLKNRFYREGVFRAMQFAISKMRQGYGVKDVVGVSAERVQEIINTGNVDAAESIISGTFGSVNRALWRDILGAYKYEETQAKMKGGING